MHSRWWKTALAWLFWIGSAAAGAAPPQMGQLTLTHEDGTPAVTLFYPAAGTEQPVQRGAVTVAVVPNAAPLPAASGQRRRLIVISHGSGGTPWVHADLARALVQAGYVVAAPWHRGDNALDPGEPGPVAWARRPLEVSDAIDRVAVDERFAPGLLLDRVGVYGMSAGGHTALTLAGGSASPAGFKRHCDAHLDDDFAFCAGLYTQLTGSVLDGLRRWAVRSVHGWRFSSEQPYRHHDARVAAVVAAVPAAADFDLATLARPALPLGLVVARQDRWLKPELHALAVLQACPSCELVADLRDGGHGALLSPLPQGLSGIAAQLLNDPPGFDRAQLVQVHQRIVGFFDSTLKSQSGSAVMPE